MIKALHIIVTALVLFPAVAPAQPKAFDWLLAYYMPYDNNLSSLGPGIVHEFKRHHLKGNVCILLQSDLAGPGGMKRYTIHSRIDSAALPDENSASTATFRSFLQWASTFKAKHHAIVLLNHGGTLNDYGLDEYPAKSWLPIDSVAAALRQFDHDAGSTVDLLFEQVCARGTLENVYEFKDVASYTMVSQGLVPAPGYYYTTVFDQLDRGEIKDGRLLAKAIVGAERKDMYYSFSLVDNFRWDAWLKAFDSYVLSLGFGKAHIPVKAIVPFSYWENLYWDTGPLISQTSVDDVVPAAAASLAASTRELIPSVYDNPESTLMNGYSGLSILSPFQTHIDERLAIYKLKSYQKWIGIIRGMRGNKP